MNRRDFIARMIALGLSSTSLAWLLAGCGSVGGTDRQSGAGKLEAGDAPAGARPDGSPSGGWARRGTVAGAPKAQTGGAKTVEPNYPDVDLAIASGTDPDTLMAKGLQAMGGIQRFVRPGCLVVIKPNFSVPTTPDEACTTNPLLVSSLVRLCLQAGAKEVRVIDHTFNNGTMCLDNTGMRQYCEAAGAKVYVLNTLSSSYYSSVSMNGELLTTAYYSKDVLDADLFVNFPILKHHATTMLTMGMKNMMGLVWDRGFFHSTDLYHTIAELTAFKKPDLIIMDALRGITANGPGGPARSAPMTRSSSASIRWPWMPMVRICSGLTRSASVT